MSRAMLLPVMALLLALTLLPGGARAQVAARLVADRVDLSGQVLTASGNVTVFANGQRMTARQITYDGTTEKMTITGPILVVSEDGSVVTATQASLSRDLRTGILLGARLVLDQRLQMAAGRIDRAGPLTQMTGVAATSCHVCPGQAPLWSIRADRVIHDADAGQLWFEDATFRIRNTPVLWLPRMRLPDPSQTRMAGFLLPKFTSSNELGVGLKLPYFVPLGDTRDITITPWLSQRARRVELRYRQAFSTGYLTATAAVSRDDFGTGTRGYLFADGWTRLPHGFRLDGQLRLASDDDYLLAYGIDDTDRLDSALTLSRITGRQLSFARVTGYHSLRGSENNATQPSTVGMAFHRARHDLGGALLTWELSADGYKRRSDAPGGDGRDGVRVGAAADLTRRWIFGPGLELGVTMAARSDYFALDDEAPDDDSGARSWAGGAATLSWPLLRQGERVTHLIEPRVTLGWSGSRGATAPNEDSTRTELDRVSLHGLNRYPGEDAVEDGRRVSASLRWTATDLGGNSLTLSLGRSFRQSADDTFTPTSGLQDARSDWLLVAGLDLSGGLSLDSRTVINDRRQVAKSESRIRWDSSRVALSATHVFLRADLYENRIGDVSEWTLDGAFRLTDEWELKTDARYDIASDRPVSAGIGLNWRNECVQLGLSASRRFTRLNNVNPSTKIGLQISVDGFSATTSGLRPARACRN